MESNQREMKGLKVVALHQTQSHWTDSTEERSNYPERETKSAGKKLTQPNTIE